MSDYVGRFIIDSKIRSTMSNSVSLPAAAGTANQFASFVSDDGAHGLFIVVKDASKGMFYQFSLSIPYGTTGGSWLEVMPLEYVAGTDRVSLDVFSDGITLTLRLRKVAGNGAIDCDIITYNIGNVSVVTPVNIDETDATVAGTIASVTVPSNSGTSSNDHNSLLHIGTNTHDQIDLHIADPNPHSGHELLSNKGAAGGYPSLGLDSKVLYEQLPVGSEENTVCAGDDPRLSVFDHSSVFEGVDLSSQIGQPRFNIHSYSPNFTPGSLKVYINGSRQVSGLQYTEYPNSGEFEISGDIALDSEDSVSVDFRISESNFVFEGVDLSGQSGGVYDLTSFSPEYVPGSLRITVNGMAQISGVQYIESPSEGTFEFVSGVLIDSTDKVIADFRRPIS